MIDATPALPEQLSRLGGLDGILLTHAHMGHYTGLLWLGREGMGARAMPLYVRPKLADFLRNNGPWSQLVRLGNVELREVESVQLGALRATAVPVPHRDEFSETVAWHIEGPNRSALYLPDIDSWEGWPLEEWLSRVDVAWLDGTFWADGELERDMTEIPHPRVRDTLARLPRDLLARVRFTHLNHTNPLLDPASPQCATVIAAGATVAVEGEEVAL
jgi:pyrroloquinoline quinone biosynthesis protein B